MEAPKSQSKTQARFYPYSVTLDSSAAYVSHLQCPEFPKHLFWNLTRIPRVPFGPFLEAPGIPSVPTDPFLESLGKPGVIVDPIFESLQ